MAAFQLCYLEPKYRTIQARDITDAQRQARMMIDDMNSFHREDPVVLR